MTLVETKRLEVNAQLMRWFVSFAEFFTVRRYALHGICYRNSVCLSVTLVDCTGSPRARALNEGGVSMNWRFSTNKPPYLRNGARYDKGYY